MFFRKSNAWISFKNIFRSSFRRVLSTRHERKVKNEMIRMRLAAAYRGLNMYGLNEGICNHLSAIAPSIDNGGSVMLIIPYGLHWSEVTPALLIGVDENKQVIEGKGQPETTAVCIHQGIYSKRPDIKCVMHTHMPYTTALTCLEKPELLMLHQNSTRFYDQIAYDSSYGGISDTFAEGKRLATVLGNKSVLFMGNHGAITVSDSVAIAFDNMYYLERASMIQVLAYSTQRALKELTPETVQQTSKQIWSCLDEYANSHLAAILHKLRNECSDFGQY